MTINIKPVSGASAAATNDQKKAIQAGLKADSVTLADANNALTAALHADVLCKSDSAVARTHTFANNGWVVDQEVTIDVNGAGAVTVLPAMNGGAVGGVTVVGSALLAPTGAQYDTLNFVVTAAGASSVTFKRRS